MCHNDELSSMMSYVGCLLTGSKIFLILFAENSHIFRKTSVIPILLTFMYLVGLNLLVKTTTHRPTQLVIAAHNCHTGINKILLENILPAHVAEHYLLGVQGVSGLADSNVMLSFFHSDGMFCYLFVTSKNEFSNSRI